MKKEIHTNCHSEILNGKETDVKRLNCRRKDRIRMDVKETDCDAASGFIRLRKRTDNRFILNTMIKI